jgi:hypothetical protein
VIWSYLHVHPLWVEETVLMVNATPASLGLLSNGLDAARFQLSNATSHVDFLYQLARQRDGRRVCHYRRSSRLVEEVEGTAEVAGRFYRRAVGCNSFDMQAGMPFVAFVIASPDSKEAAVAPSSGIASVHTFFRLFANFRGTSGPVLDEGDGIKWDKPELAALAMSAGCAMPARPGSCGGWCCVCCVWHRVVVSMPVQYSIQCIKCACFPHKQANL